MYNMRQSVGSFTREASPCKSSLGNNTPRYLSDVKIERKKYFISSSRNSQDIPDWMARTQSFHLRENHKKASLFANAESPFKCVNQTYIYSRQKKAVNLTSQFEPVSQSQPRNHWQLKNHTFELEWPKNERIAVRSTSQLQRKEDPNGFLQRPTSRQNEIMRFVMPKYAIRESPLHKQKQTAIKIGHPYLLNSTCIK